MCEQCVAKTVYYIGKDTNEVLPGYILVRATKNGSYMKKGNWGLVRYDNPDFIWSITPVCDPSSGLSDEQIDALPKEVDKQYEQYEKAVKNLRKSLNKGCFDHCVSLGEAMKKSGWKPEKDGFGPYWLCHYIGQFLKTATVKEEQELDVATVIKGLGDNT
jgi:hypothetical protein